MSKKMTENLREKPTWNLPIRRWFLKLSLKVGNRFIYASKLGVNGSGNKFKYKKWENGSSTKETIVWTDLKSLKHLKETNRQ